MMDDDIFDPEILIEEVKKRPILWNTTAEEFNDKEKKHDTWLELTAALFPNGSEKNRPKTAATLMKKWKNIRDNYMRDIRKKRFGSLRTKKRRYIYANECSFLDVIIGVKPATRRRRASEGRRGDSSEEDSECGDSSQGAATFASAVEAEVSVGTPDVTSASTADAGDDAAARRALEESMICYLRAHGAAYKPDDDESFFDSILPTVRQFDMDQKIEFRIQVMALIQNIRRNNATATQYFLPIQETGQQ